jgi:hypothetical protein
MLEERLRPTDCVLIYRDFTRRPLSYYYRKQLPCQLLPKSEADPELKDIAGDRLFVVLSHASPAERDQILETLRSDLWLARQKFSFHGVKMIEFGKPE